MTRQGKLAKTWEVDIRMRMTQENLEAYKKALRRDIFTVESNVLWEGKLKSGIKMMKDIQGGKMPESIRNFALSTLFDDDSSRFVCELNIQQGLGTSNELIDEFLTRYREIRLQLRKEEAAEAGQPLSECMCLYCEGLMQEYSLNAMCTDMMIKDIQDGDWEIGTGWTEKWKAGRA